MTPTDEKTLVVTKYETNTRQKATITCLDNQDPPLLRLPAELRNMIYGYVFKVQWIKACYPRYPYSASRDCIECMNNLTQYLRIRFHYPYQLLALTTTCQQVHNETKLLPFAVNELRGNEHSLHRAITYSLNQEQRRAITTVCLRLASNGFGYQYLSIKNLDEFPLQAGLAEAVDSISYLPNLKQLTITTGFGAYSKLQGDIAMQYKEVLTKRVSTWVNHFALNRHTEIRIMFPHECRRDCELPAFNPKCDKENEGNASVE